MSALVPFTVDVPEADLDGLRSRILQTRWPEAEPVPDGTQGVPRHELEALCAHWVDGYDWRATERRLNAIPQHLITIEDLQIHVLHARSPEPDAIPLVLTHGWPGSVLDFLKVVGPLVDPSAHGGDRADAFHVVCPSLPGYGFSARPRQPGWDIHRIASAWSVVMHRLGYRRFGAAGADWGTSISTLLGRDHPDEVIGIHLVPPLAAPDPSTFAELSASERAALDDAESRRRTGSAYGLQHATRPQTIGYSLVDSPVGLCAWIAEKYRDWSDDRPEARSSLTRDDVLDAVTLYWLTGTGASAARLYWESIDEVTGWFTDDAPDVVDVPTGCSTFAYEVPRASRRWAARRFTDIRHWGELDRGGHFAALEQPDLLVSELRAFFRHLR